VLHLVGQLLIYFCAFCCYITIITIVFGARGSVFGCDDALQVGRLRVRFPMVSLEVFIDIILPVALCLGGRLIL